MSFIPFTFWSVTLSHGGISPEGRGEGGAWGLCPLPSPPLPIGCSSSFVSPGAAAAEHLLLLWAGGRLVCSCCGVGFGLFRSFPTDSSALNPAGEGQTRPKKVPGPVWGQAVMQEGQDRGGLGQILGTGPALSASRCFLPLLQPLALTPGTSGLLLLQCLKPKGLGVLPLGCSVPPPVVPCLP